ncbi:hypothetical protein J6590_027335 [Homalodisca vitripennis]|nr:hypothetical protein J6590_027335 [Homalodisca vitripennis]
MQMIPLWFLVTITFILLKIPLRIKRNPPLRGRRLKEACPECPDRYITTVAPRRAEPHRAVSLGRSSTDMSFIMRSGAAPPYTDMPVHSLSW